jgi:hypothetical protein
MDAKKDLNEFAQCLGLCFDLCKVEKPSAAATRFFFMLVQEFDLADVKAAMQHHAKNSPYAPKPCDVVEFLRGSVEDRAMLAWNTVKSAMRRRCSSDSVRFDDPAIHWVVMRMGGWPAMFDVGEYEHVAQERSFRALYEQGERGAAWENVPPYLMGTCEISMRANRMLDSIRPPIDADAAALSTLKVLEGGKTA